MPEHCGGDIFGSATEMRMACDAFFKRRGLNSYGGKSAETVGMKAIIKRSADQGKARKLKRAC